MNQEQRKFLIGKIESTYKEQVKTLEAKVPEEPTMNRHLISAFLDGSIKIKDAKVIKANLIKHVKALGSSELTKTEYSYNGRRRRDEEEVLMLDPELILEMPKSYKEALSEYTKTKTEVDKKIAELTTQKDTLILKIQIGSNAILDKLINQVDSLGDLNLFSNKLSLIASGIEEPKQIAG